MLTEVSDNNEGVVNGENHTYEDYACSSPTEVVSEFLERPVKIMLGGGKTYPNVVVAQTFMKK